MALTYTDYLRIDDLLNLQSTKSSEHDETLFIIIHQVYELWFKQTLHEFDLLQSSFAREDTPVVLHTLKRVLSILKTMVVQVDVLETMTPLSFSSFRDRLESASGFQSAQFREFEFLLGKKDGSTMERFQSPARERLMRRYEQPTLLDSFLLYLEKKGYAIPEVLLKRDVTAPHEPSVELQKVLIDVYERDLITAQICERLVDLDEGIQEWRYRHVKMVERTIGNKMGTGGSSGVNYLRSTLFQPAFPDLWAIRSQF